MVRTLNLSGNKTPLPSDMAGRGMTRLRSSNVKAVIKELWNTPYDADPLLEPDFDGLTYGQAIILRQMQHAAAGYGDSVDRILDRLIGKPMQVNANMNTTGTYKEFLEELARKEGLLDDPGPDGRPQAEDAELVE